MACIVCGKEGGYECPTCYTDYCEEHYEMYVCKLDVYQGIDENDKCERCGAVL